MRTHRHAHAGTYVHTYIQAYTRICMHACIHACKQTDLHTRTFIHARASSCGGPHECLCYEHAPRAQVSPARPKAHKRRHASSHMITGPLSTSRLFTERDATTRLLTRVSAFVHSLLAYMRYSRRLATSNQGFYTHPLNHRCSNID